MSRRKTEEGSLKQQLLDHLNTLGAVVEPLHTGQGKGPGGYWRTPKTSRGRPDLVMLFNCLPIAIEVKTKEGNQNENQIEWQMRWIANGGIYWTIRSLDGLIDNLAALVQSYW